MALEYLTPHLTMGQETLAECLDDQTKALLLLHWQEIAPHQDIPLDPNYAVYVDLEDRGFLRCYIVRDHGIVQGYCAFVVVQSRKCQTSTEAFCDVLWLVPRLRRGRLGIRFLTWCDEQLAKEGVQVIRHFVQRTYDFSPILTRLGYEQEQTVYARRVDRG